MCPLIRQTIRGCGTLPHVGEHPGTIYVIAFVGAGIVAGLMKFPNPVIGAIGGGSIAAVVFLPMYLAGAYSRATLSDRLTLKSKVREPADG